MKKYVVHEKEFRVDAVKLVIEQGLSVKTVSERMGIKGTLLYKWIEQYRNYGEEAFCGSGYLLTMEAKLRKKDREIADLKEQNEILKKAAAYFAKNRKKE